jgi:hypothetical protein
MHLVVLDVLVFLIITLWIQRIVQYRRRNVAGLPLPPGPNGLPLLGNVLNFPKTDGWLKAAEWGKTYGEY